MNGKDESRFIYESQEWEARRLAQLENIYEEEKRKSNNSNNYYSTGECNSPFIHVSNESSINPKYNITLSDSQFKEFMNLIERNLK